MPVTIISAILLLKTGKIAKIKGDAALAMISVGSMAFGYLLLNLFSASANISGDVCSTLFGSTSILTLTGSDIILCVSMSIVVILIFVLFYNRIFAVTFDESFASATGVNASACNLLIAITTAVVIVLAMNLVGALLTSALIIFPGTFRHADFQHLPSGDRLRCRLCCCHFRCRNFDFHHPVNAYGATIVVTDLLVFGICSLIGKIKTC